MENNENEWVLDLPLTKQGSSLAVSIPAKVLRQLNLKHGDRVRIILTQREGE